MARLLLLLSAAILVVPSANLHRLDGLPLSTGPELVGLTLLVPFAASRALRRAYAGWLRALGGRLPPGCRAGLVCLALLALAVKLGLLAAGAHAGFLACYRSPAAAPPAGACERSYENPFARFGVTRLDRAIDFGPTDWDLSFVNSVRFNFYPWVAGTILRERLPLDVSWQGVVEHARPLTAQVTYVGAATLGLDGVVVQELPRHYGRLVTLPWTIPAGRHAVTIHYDFDDGTRAGAARPIGPWATLRIRLAEPDTPAGPLAAANPGRLWRGLGLGVDVVAILLALPIVVFYARLLAPDAWILALVAAGGPAAYLWRVTSSWLPRGPGFLLTLLFLLGVVLARPRGRRLLLAYFAVVYLALFTALRGLPSLQTVLYRSAGDDWLTYESLARSILETWSWRGGEPVFYYQPLFRYLRFAGHLLLGDGDAFLLVAALTALHWAILRLLARLWRGPRPAAAGAALFVATGGLLLALASSASVVGFIQAPLSESPTWMLLPLAFPMLYASRSSREWRGGAALLALSLLTRTNQAPGVLGLLLVFLRRAQRLRPQGALHAGLGFVAIALFPLAHNLGFGGRWVPLTTSADIPVNLVLPPGRWLALGHDPAVRALAWQQIRGILYLTTSGEALLQVVLRGLQVAWLVAALGILTAWRRVTATARWLLAVPALYLGVHLVFVVTVYYPRHILVGYLAMGAVTLYAVRALADARAWSPGVYRAS